MPEPSAQRAVVEDYRAQTWTIRVCSECGKLLHGPGGCPGHGGGRAPLEIEVAPAEQLRGAVEAIDAATQVIMDALSALDPPAARQLMTTLSYKTFAAHNAERGR